MSRCDWMAPHKRNCLQIDDSLDRNQPCMNNKPTMFCTDIAYINTDTRTPYRDIALSVTYRHYIKTAMILLINESIIMLSHFICCIYLMIHNKANALKYSAHRLGLIKPWIILFGICTLLYMVMQIYNWIDSYTHPAYSSTFNMLDGATIARA